ncbi:MAG TPA: co-chaperone GroES [Candidatus Pacearchaeota archaeon]|nr:co-chaperone GroES [Candidatus Pacearchaeota archaeon]
MKLKPLTNHVVIEPVKPEEKTKSGIVLPSIGEESPEQGVVIAIGSDEKIEVKVGDKVIFSKYGPTKAKVEDKDYLIASQDDILAIIEE